MTSVMTIFAHQDDETFSAGGTLAKYAHIGNAYAVTVTADPKRETEFVTACATLGVVPINLGIESLDSVDYTEVLHRIVATIRQYKPTHIITHIDFDYHRDHRKVRELVVEAVEWVSHTTGGLPAHQIASLWAAETTVLIPFPHIYIDTSQFQKVHLQAIVCYESQAHKGGQHFYSKFHTTRTQLRGIQAGCKSAEAFLQIAITRAGSFKPTKVFTEFP